MLTISEIANLVKGTVEGPSDLIINGLSKIEEGVKGSLSFLHRSDYEPFIYTTQSSALLVSNEFIPQQPVNVVFIRVANPYLAFNSLLEIFYPPSKHKIGIEKQSHIAEGVEVGVEVYIGAFAYISEGCKIGKGSKIYPNAFLGKDVIVGENTVICPNVVVYQNGIIGNQCIIHSGCIIGSDGFGYTQNAEHQSVKIPQVGNVIIEDFVELGSNVCIDRATLGSTRIGRGVKLDNMVHIAHNVRLGENTLIAAQSGISGSTDIGKNCMIGGQVGVVGHIELADFTQIGAQSGVSKSVTEKGTVLRGAPAQPLREQLKIEAMQRQLPDILQRLNNIEAKLKEILKK